MQMLIRIKIDYVRKGETGKCKKLKGVVWWWGIVQ